MRDHRYDYIETGSLMDILIPSEERKISMFPMDYEEFLWAAGDRSTFPLLQKAFKAKKPRLFTMLLFKDQDFTENIIYEQAEQETVEMPHRRQHRLEQPRKR